MGIGPGGGHRVIGRAPGGRRAGRRLGRAPGVRGRGGAGVRRWHRAHRPGSPAAPGGHRAGRRAGRRSGTGHRGVRVTGWAFGTWAPGAGHWHRASGRASGTGPVEFGRVGHRQRIAIIVWRITLRNARPARDPPHIQAHYCVHCTPAAIFRSPGIAGPGIIISPFAALFRAALRAAHCWPPGSAPLYAGNSRH